jgi:glucose-1-phosphate cytidylyltransferase
MMNDIPVIILAGGLGTRILEESVHKPKPMILIGTEPILWHIMKIYALQGFTNFIIATGYKHELVDYWIQEKNQNKSWGFNCNVKSIYTGENSQTGGRLSKILEIEYSETYMLTYGDGLANINISKLVKFHFSHNKIMTVTSVRPPARFGYISSRNGLVTRFGEKNQIDTGWINGGFFVVNQRIKNYLMSDLEPLEANPIRKLVDDQELMTNKHYGFWQPMDTLREKKILEEYNSMPLPPWLDFNV